MKRCSTLTILVLIVTVLYGLRPTEIQAAVKEYGPYASVFNFSVSNNHWATQVYKGNYPNLESFFVVDGKEYGPYSLSYFNPIVSDNGWVFPYETSDEKLMVRVSNGQEYGPYTNIGDDLQMAGMNWGFIRTQIDPFQQFVVINGKEYGPYNSVETLRIGEGVWAYVYQKNKDSEYRVNVNGTDYGYYKSYLDVNVYVKGASWGLIHRSSSVSNAQEQTTFIINGKTYGPYDVDATTNGSYSQLALTEKRWGYVYKQNDVYHIIIDGNEYTTTEDVTSLQIGDELWGYRYVISGEPTINLSGERTTSFIVVNGKKYGPFTKAGNFVLADTVWGVDYIKDGQLFVHYNNTDYGPYPWAGSGAASTFSASDNHWGIQYTRSDGFFVIVDEVEYGPFAGGLRVSDTVWALRTSDVNVPETDERDYIVISTDKPLPPVDTNARPDDSVNYWGVEENSNTQHRAITNTQLYNTIKGKILLKVEDAGKAYYVHPTTKRAYYLGRPDDSFAVMRG